MTTMKDVMDADDAVRERRDRIVAAAERYDAAEVAFEGVDHSDTDYAAKLHELQSAKYAVREACEPIKPPCKTLLSDDELDGIIGDAGRHDAWRDVGAATLEAMAKDLRQQGWPEAARMCNTRAKKERDHSC
jgi:hypothetical protein